MKPIFTIHAGEYLVGEYLENKYKKSLSIWLPAKDTGIDLLLTNPLNKKQVSLQVKYSKDFQTLMEPKLTKKLTVCGWWTLNSKKINESKADFWVFILNSFNEKISEYVIIEPKKLSELFQNLKRPAKTIQSYIWVTKSNQCWETRGVSKEEQNQIVEDVYKDENRNLTKYLNNWSQIENMLEIQFSNNK